MSTVDHPPHYNLHPSGLECIDVAESWGFNLGNALKYLWRAGYKGAAKEDFEKALWYISREVTRRRGLRDDPLKENADLGLAKFVVTKEPNPLVAEAIHALWGAVASNSKTSISELEEAKRRIATLIGSMTGRTYPESQDEDL